VSERSSGGFRSAWSGADFRNLLSGLVVSGTGNWLYNVALLVYVLDRTGSPGWVAAVSVAKLLPLILFSAIGGVLADRYDRRRVMLASDLIRAALMVALAATVVSDGFLVLVLAVVAVDSVVATPYFPAVGALTPSLVADEDLAAANALTGVVDNITITLGPALGSVLLLMGSPSMAIALNAITFLVSALFVWRIRNSDVGDSDAEPESLRHRLTTGVRAMTSSPDIMLLVLISLGFTLTFGMEIVLFPLIADELLSTGADGLGWLLGASGLGGVLGTWLAARLASRPRTGSILVAATILTALPLLALTVIGEPAIAYLVLLVEGVGFVVGDVITVTTIQRVAAGAVVGRVFGLLDTVFIAAILAGNLLAGVAVNIIGLRPTMVVGSAILVGCGLIALPRARRLDRDAYERAAAVADRVSLLERLRIFDGASQVALESVATAATELHVSPGTVVVREGELADAFYVIRAGTLTVVRAEITLGPEDYFGEIGILEHVPRTATVTATTGADLYRIDADAFVAALNEAPAGMRRLADTLAGRLARTHPAQRPRFTAPDGEAHPG
jgi:predicted MFS family arabinose efflux permease